MLCIYVITSGLCVAQICDEHAKIGIPRNQPLFIQWPQLFCQTLNNPRLFSFFNNNSVRLCFLESKLSRSCFHLQQTARTVPGCSLTLNLCHQQLSGARGMMTHRQMQEHYGMEDTLSSEDNQGKTQTCVAFSLFAATPELVCLLMHPNVFVLSLCVFEH